MISKTDINCIKNFAKIIVNLIPGGVLFGIVEGDTITWKINSDSFDMEIFNVGNKVNENSVSKTAMREKRTLTQKVSRSVYGKRLFIAAEPIIDENGEAYGSFTIAFPRFHPVAGAFSNFAPIISGMFPDGVFLYVTDLERINNVQASDKFDMPSIRIGYELKETDIAYKTIHNKQTNIVELDASKYGVPIMVTNSPLFDEENRNEVVATFGIVMPKTTAEQLKEMSQNLKDNLSGISSAIQELAASAALIHSNEQGLNTNINEINGMSDEIRNVSDFIKDIAGETNMLGLNAAIEAARAGEVGRGFGIVAKEIRKLSEQSKGTVPQINSLTDNIKGKVDEAIERSRESLGSSQEQAAATEEITASIEEIIAMTETLNEIAKKL